MRHREVHLSMPITARSFRKVASLWTVYESKLLLKPLVWLLKVAARTCYIVSSQNSLLNSHEGNIEVHNVMLSIHYLVVMNTEPIVPAATRTTLVDLRAWAHIIYGMNDTNRDFRRVDITVILVTCTSLGILMTRSLSGVRVNPLLQSTVVSWVVFVLWMGRASSRRLIAHMIHICSTDKFFLQITVRSLVLSDMQQ